MLVPSRHQAGNDDSGEYQTDIEKYIREKNMRTVLALVDGIRKEDEARRWLGEANRIGVHEKVHSAVIEKVEALSE